MECGGWIGIESTLRNLVRDCSGVPALSIEPSATMNFNTSVPLDCYWQDFSIESLLARVLNTDGTAIKTLTGTITCEDYCDCDCPDWESIVRQLIVEGDDGELYLKVGECSETCTEFFDCDNNSLCMESLFKGIVSDSSNPFVKIVFCSAECGDYFDCGDTEGLEDIFRLLLCEEGIRVINCD